MKRVMVIFTNAPTNTPIFNIRAVEVFVVKGDADTLVPNVKACLALHEDLFRDGLRVVFHKFEDGRKGEQLGSIKFITEYASATNGKVK